MSPEAYTPPHLSKNAAATVRSIQHHVLPYLPRGVPLAVAAANPSLRLCAERYRANDNYTRDARTDELQPRLLSSGTYGSSEDGFAVYDAKRARCCGVRVGPLLMLLHDTDEEQQRHQDAERLQAVLRDNCEHHRADWRPSTSRLPPLRSVKAADLIALHEAAVADGPLGGAAQTPLASLAQGTPYGVSAWPAPLDGMRQLSEGLGGSALYFMPMLLTHVDDLLERAARLRCDAGTSLVWRHMLRSRGGGGGGCTPYAAHEGAGEHAQEGPWKSTQRHDVAGPPRFKRSLYLWAEGVELSPAFLRGLLGTGAPRYTPTTSQPTSAAAVAVAAVAPADSEDAEAGSQDAVRDARADGLWRLLSVSRWWLLRPAVPCLRQEPLRVRQSVPTHLHVYSSDMQLVRAACHALCGASGQPNGAAIGDSPPLDFSSHAGELCLEGFHLASYRTAGLRISAEDGPLFPQQTLSHVKLLKVADCRCTSRALRAVLRPADNTEGAPPAPPSASSCCEASPLIAWMPQLEAVDLSGLKEVDGSPFLFPACSAAEEERFQLSLELVKPSVLPTLTSLNLSRTAVGDEWLALIAWTCSQLAALSVSGCVAVTDLRGLSRLPGTNASTGLTHTLWFLDASITSVSSAGVACLGELQQLRHVSLSNCTNMKDVTPLSQLPRLRRLELMNCNIHTGLDLLYTRDCLEQLLLSDEMGSWRRDWTAPSADVAGLFVRLRSPTTLLSLASGELHAFAALSRLMLANVNWFDDGCVAVLAAARVPLEALSLDSLPSLTSLNALWWDGGALATEPFRCGPRPVLQDTLHTLLLRGNRHLSIEGLRGLASCTALRSVTSLYCPLLGNLCVVLAQVPSLRALYIASADENQLDRVERLGLGAYTANVAATAMTGASASAATMVVGGMTSAQRAPAIRELDTLSLCDNEWLEGLDFLSGMPRLTYLNLQSTGVTAESLADGVEAHLFAVAALPPPRSPLMATPVSFLHLIDLEYCDHLESVNCLARLPSLRSVRLTSSAVTDEGIEALLFSPHACVEAIDLTHCEHIHLNFDVPSVVARLWNCTVVLGGSVSPEASSPARQQSARGSAATAGQRRFASSSLRSLSLVGNRKITDAALTALFRPIVAVPHCRSDASAPHRGIADTFFPSLSKLDLSVCVVPTTVEPLLPLSGSLRVLSLRGSIITSAGLARVHELALLESLDLQDTMRISSIDAVLTHPGLKQLDLRGLQPHPYERDGGRSRQGVAAVGDEEPYLDLFFPTGGHTGSSASSNEASNAQDSFTVDECEEESRALLLPSLAPTAPSSAAATVAASLVPQVAASSLEVLLLSIGSPLLKECIAPLLLHGTPFETVDSAAVASEAKPSEATQEPAEGVTVGTAVAKVAFPSLKTLCYRGNVFSPSTADCAVLLGYIKLTRPLLVLKRS